MASNIKAGGVDLDSIFEPRGATTARANVGYKVSGTDIAQRYMASTGGDQIGYNTGIKSGSTDLRYLFRDLAYTGLPTITVQPSGHTGNEGVDYTLSLTATGDPTITYDWQKSNDGSTGWTTVSPGNGFSSYTKTNPPPLALYYRCAVTNPGGTVYSNVVFVLVRTDAHITVNPSDQSVNDGDIVGFQCAAGGDGTLYFAWQEWDGGSWTDLNPARTGNVSGTQDQHVFNAALSQNGNLFRCIVSNSYGGADATSSSATLTVS